MNVKTVGIATRRVWLTALLVLGIALVNPRTADAHHSPAAFDTRKTITVTGVVTKYEWANPHVYVTVEESVDGKTREWEVECPPPSMMNRMGWNKETLRIGETLSIKGSPGRESSSKGLLAATIQRADNVLLDASSLSKQFAASGDAPKFVATSLTGTWLTQPNMQLIAQYAFPQASQLTPEGTQMLKSFDEKIMSPAVNCIPSAAPITMLMPDMKHVAVSDGSITIRSEFDGAQRTILIKQAAHEPIPSHQGHSIGKWEGKTLVVETAQFAYHGLGNGLGVPSGTKKRLIERFTPSADGTSITYRFEMLDEQYLKAPKTGEVKWMFRPDLKFAPVPCDLDNARRFTRH
jgi:hypothetical protein